MGESEYHGCRGGCSDLWIKEQLYVQGTPGDERVEVRQDFDDLRRRNNEGIE